MYETIRIVGQVRPKYVLWENVKNILSKKHKHNFDAYIETMNVLGYNSYYKVLDAKDYGVPQHRERVYTVSIRKDIDSGYEFPEPMELKLRLKDVLEDEVEEKYYLSDIQIERIKTTTYNVGKTRIQEKEYCDTLCARDWKDPKCIKIKNATKKGYDEATEGDSINLQHPNSKTRRGRVGHQVAQTIMSNDSIGVVDNYRIRKLTPKECWRLMGFDDEDFEKAERVPTSNTQLYKQAGNSIVVNVLEKIFKNLFQEDL